MMNRNIIRTAVKVAFLLCAVSAVAVAISSSATQSTRAVARIWHGRTLTSKADEYYAYLKKEGIDKIEAIKGNLGTQVLRRPEGNTTEFVVISYWESRDAIRRFAGDDIEKAHFLPRDREYLLEPETQVKHFDLIHDRK